MLELVETERDYVRDLGVVVDGYMEILKTMVLSDELKTTIIWANIPAIFEFHKLYLPWLTALLVLIFACVFFRTFQTEIEKCLENYTTILAPRLSNTYK